MSAHNLLLEIGCCLLKFCQKFAVSVRKLQLPAVLIFKPTTPLGRWPPIHPPWCRHAYAGRTGDMHHNVRCDVFITSQPLRLRITTNSTRCGMHAVESEMQ